MLFVLKAVLSLDLKETPGRVNLELTEGLCDYCVTALILGKGGEMYQNTLDSLEFRHVCS